MAPKKPGKKKKKRLASLQDPTIEAIAEGMFRFASESQAVSLMQRLSEQFAIADDQDLVKEGECPSLKIWVRDYDVTKDEAIKGYKGNFIHVRVKHVAGDKYTLAAEKISLPLKKHPFKERPQRRHPNNGHPVIRAAQRNKTYPAIEQARTLLLKMHEEFPETSIPGRDKLHVLLYSRQVRPPIRKITIRIVAAGEDSYKFEVSDNVRDMAEKDVAGKKASKPAAKTVKEDDKMVDGKFTSMVALQRKKKVAKPKKSGS